MTKAEFFLKIKEAKDKLNTKIRSSVKMLEGRLDRIE
jgi:hypothetical protein